MKSNRDDTINELAAELEDLTVTVEELQSDPPANVEQKSLASVERGTRSGQRGYRRTRESAGRSDNCAGPEGVTVILIDSRIGHPGYGKNHERRSR